MTSERKKAILTLTGTLIIGILLGMLIPGLFHKVRGRGEGGYSDRRGGSEIEHKREWFTGTIYRIIQPDSAQAKQIKPITQWAAARIDSLETSSNEGLAAVMDSVKMKLKPIITQEQFKRLDDFDARAKGHWQGGRGRHGSR
jgi:hypothetical protein